MSTGRAVLTLAALSVSAAALLAIVARTPAEIRTDRPSAADFDPTLGATFTDAQITRAERYRRPAYLGFALALGLEIAALVVLSRGPLRRLVDSLDVWPGGWPVRAAVTALIVGGVLAAVALPMGYVRGLSIESSWGLSTQDLTGWLADQARSLGVSGVITIVAALAFFGVVRAAPRWWWVWGWLVFTVLTAVLTLVAPVLIAPLFNRFTPLHDPALEARIRVVATEAGVAVDEVLVADASRRTRAENAYVAGFGATKRLVLYDTLLTDRDEDQALFVVAHELAHQAEGHVVKGVLLSSLGLLIGFAGLAWLGNRPGVWSWAGADGIADIRALPVILLYLVVAGTLLLPAQNAVSRSFERRADAVAVTITGDPQAAVGSFRRLGLQNIADLRPPGPVVWALFSHPPIPDRIRTALEASTNSR